MPWEKISAVPDNLKKLDDVALTLVQINAMAKQAEGAEENPDVESGWAIARAQFKKAHEVEDGKKWVAKKPKKVEKEESKNDELDHIRIAYHEQFGSDEVAHMSDDLWPGQIYDSYMIVGGRGANYKVPYQVVGEEIIFAPKPEWVEVEQVWEVKKVDESKDDEVNRIRSEFHAQFGPKNEALGTEPWPRQVYDSHIIVESQGKTYKVPYQIVDEKSVFVPHAEWVEVKQVWVETKAKKVTCEKCGTFFEPKEKELICEICGDKVEKNDQGAMFAFYVPTEISTKLAEYATELPEGSKLTPREEMHVTLVYVPQLEADTLDIVKVAESAATKSLVVDGKIGGIGRFPTEEDMEPIYIPVDAPGLEAVRETVLKELEAAGQPPSDRHGFSPHITLGYVPKGSKIDLVVPEIPIQFDKLAAAFGSVKHEFLMKKQKVLKSGQLMHLLTGIVKALATSQDMVSVWKDKKGQRWYFAAVSSAVKDYENETVTTEGMDFAIALARKHDYHNGLYVEHEVPATRVGKSVFEFRIGKFWFELGKIQGDGLADFAYKRLEDGGAKLSIGFLALAAEKKQGVYKKLWKYDTSIVSKPANPLTFIIVGGKGNMEDRVKRVLATLGVSDEEKEKAGNLLADLLAEVKSVEKVEKMKGKKAQKAALLKMLEEHDEAKALATSLLEGQYDEEEEEEMKTKAIVEDSVKSQIEEAVKPLTETLAQIQEAVVSLADLDTRLQSLEGDQTMTQVVAKLVGRLSTEEPTRVDPQVVEKDVVDDLIEGMKKELGDQSTNYQLAGFVGAEERSIT